MSVTRPTKPKDACRQLNRGQLVALFDLTFTIDEKGQVKVPATWQAENLVSIKLPIATQLATSIRVHKRAAPVFIEWFRLWSPEDCRLVKTYDGSFNPRLMRQAKNLPETKNPTKDWASFLSRHSRAIAVDLNARWNRQGTPGAAAGEPGCLWPLIEHARKVRVPTKDSFGKTVELGLVCGHDWQPAGVTDSQHFECGVF